MLFIEDFLTHSISYLHFIPILFQMNGSKYQLNASYPSLSSQCPELSLAHGRHSKIFVGRLKAMFCVDLACELKHCEILSQCNILDFLVTQIQKENYFELI
jgi:hypothetical protein